MLRTFLSVCGVEQGVGLEEKKCSLIILVSSPFPIFFLFCLLAGSPVGLSDLS